MSKNYYIVLGVQTDATQNQIKSAYRQRALELHPDRSGCDSEPFLEIQEAYTTLSDANRRHAYDRQSRGFRMNMTGRSAAEPLRARPPTAEPFTPTHLDDISLADDFLNFHPSFDELFERVSSNFDRGTRPKAERVESLVVEVPLSPEQARSGGQIGLSVPGRFECSTCGGAGAVGRYECWRCAGHGILAEERQVPISFPPGIRNNYFLHVPLDRFGIHNFYLTVCFRVSASA
jgi:molecular chaperone DnaJ